jgi:prolyl 4-hydroxylase
MVIDPSSGRPINNPVRTSYEAVIGPTRENMVIRAVNKRLAAITRTDVRQGEALTVLRYAPGQEFRPHLDTIAGARNQRIVTALLYLNDDFTGGQTFFSANSLTIEPRIGDAIVFTNVRGDGLPDPASRHAGKPVIRGVKWLATRWIRAKSFDPWFGPDVLS